MVEASLQAAYPNCRLAGLDRHVGAPPAVVRLKKHHEFIRRVKSLEGFERGFEPPVDRLMTVMAACGEPAFVQTRDDADARLLRSARQAHLQAPRGAAVA